MSGAVILFRPGGGLAKALGIIRLFITWGRFMAAGWLSMAAGDAVQEALVLKSKLTQIALHAPMEDMEAVRTHLLKAVPETIPDLFVQFEKTATAAQDQLLVMSIDVELKEAGLKWSDLANLLRFQIVAHKRATMSGFINATKKHPNHHRLSKWETDFLDSLSRRKVLLTDKQLACLQSVADSLDMSEAEFAERVKANGERYHTNNHIGELH